ncbi:unnamed protein product [Microthlaspi erraticum]|nr:unnamed protein product [Microthlaspi erraticum]
MMVAVSGYPLSKSPEPLSLCFEIPLPPAQMPFAQSSCRLVVAHVGSSFQIYLLLWLKSCLSYLLSGSPPIDMVPVTLTRLCLRIRQWNDSPPLPQYEDIKLSLSLRLPQYEVAKCVVRLRLPQVEVPLPLYEVVTQNLVSLSMRSVVMFVFLYDEPGSRFRKIRNGVTIAIHDMGWFIFENSEVLLLHILCYVLSNSSLGGNSFIAGKKFFSGVTRFAVSSCMDCLSFTVEFPLLVCYVVSQLNTTAIIAVGIVSKTAVGAVEDPRSFKWNEVSLLSGKTFISSLYVFSAYVVSCLAYCMANFLAKSSLYSCSVYSLVAG